MIQAVDRPATKILCIGNNTEDTDTRSKKFATGRGLPCHGLLSELQHQITQENYRRDGVYHTSVYDIEFDRLIGLANDFDLVVMLNQPRDTWSHPDAFLITIKLMQNLSVTTTFLDQSYQQHVSYWEDLVKNNASFCIFPFIEILAQDGYTRTCCRSSQPISPIQGLDFANDKNYQHIRQNMLNGHRLPQHCQVCYDSEARNIPSARQLETVEWANRLGLESVNDLEDIHNPVYFEVRASNRCNLQCRMCEPSSSHKIFAEYQKLNLIDRSTAKQVKKQIYSGFDIVDFSNLKKLYVAGGEPTVMPEFYTFLQTCVDIGATDFEIVVNTNGTSIPRKLKKYLEYFSNLQFIFSIDGLDQINHYIRWPSDWSKIMSNWQYLLAHRHKVMVNTTMSIYNADNLHLLYEFIDKMYPNTVAHLQMVNDPDYLSPLLHPDRSAVLHSLADLSQTQTCRNNPVMSDTVNAYVNLMQHAPLPTSLQLGKFFEFNDTLDQSRRVRCHDYLPNLQRFRGS